MFDRILKWVLHEKEPSKIPTEINAPRIEDAGKKEHEFSKGWRRTTGYRNFINRRRWMPVIDGQVAKLQSGRQYYMWSTGWRRIPGA